jgi:hypothetical protein
LSGVPGDVYHVLASTNLLDWQPIATVTNMDGTIQFTDTAATNYPAVLPVGDALSYK